MNTHMKNLLKGTTMGVVASAALFLPMMAEAGSTVHVTHDGTNYGTGNNGKFVALPSPTNGADGKDGATGATGATGAQGAQGQQGEAGKDGLDGATGLTGAAGTNGTNGKDGTNGQDGATGPKGDKGDRGNDGTNGTNGTNGTDGANGLDGANGIDGTDGDRGADGVDAVAPLGSLSFAAASASFYGDGIGFGLSASTYSDLEGSIVFGFDLNNDWRVVAGITTDFKGKTAGSVGVGVSF